MFVADESSGKLTSVSAKRLVGKQVKVLGAALAQRIMEQLVQESTYPRKLAKKLRVHEQLVYYHIRKLERAGLIDVARRENVQGTLANFYVPTASAFVFLFKELGSASKLPGVAKADEFLSPIIENGEFNGMIVVGSPDPHGPEMARSRDGYYGIDLALFLGTFLTGISKLCVRLDTEVRSEELQGNLVLIGGPVVNMITSKMNDRLPVRFDKKHNWSIVSTISNKRYFGDECGIIVKAKNPFNSKKWVLVVAGKRYQGTRAVTIALLKHFHQVVKGNAENSEIAAKVVEGLDRDADGIVDDVRFVE